MLCILHSKALETRGSGFHHLTTTQALHPFAFVFTQYNGMHIDDATCAHKLQTLPITDTRTYASVWQLNNTTTGPDLQSNELAKFLRGAITHGDSLVIMNQPVICCKIADSDFTLR